MVERIEAETILPEKWKKFQVDTQLVRSKSWDPSLSVAINRPDTVQDIVKNLPSSDRERLIVLYLNTKNVIVGIEQITIGSKDASLVPVDAIMRAAILANASGLILAHNHPSGSTEPSQEDIAISKRLKEAGRLFNIEMLDMVIVADSRYNSLRSGGLI